MGLVDSLFGFVLGNPVTAVLVGSVVLIALLVVMFPDRAVGLKKRTDIPTVEDSLVPILGNTLAFVNKMPYIHETVLEWARKHGDAVRVTMVTPQRPIDIVVTTNVKDVEHILRDPYTYEKGYDQRHVNTDLFGTGIFVVDGDSWKVQRKTASNIFNVRAFRDMYTPVFLHDASRVAYHLAAASKQDAFVDLHDLLLRSTMDSFCKISMGSDVSCLAGEGTVVNGRYTLPDIEFARAFDTLNNICASRQSKPMWEISEKLDGTSAKLKWSQDVLDGFSRKVIAKKRADRSKSGGGPSGPSDDKNADLLDHFLSVKHDDGSELSDIELVDIVRNFIVAGRDTTAQTLTWVWYRLAANPEVLKKLRAEFLSVLGNDEEASYEHFNTLKYAQAVFSETLRLHANVPLNFKVPTHDDVLPGSGTKVAANSRVMFSPYAMGYLERIWGPDATEFKPERWIDEKGDLVKESAFKWPVFNAGPRICLGMNMAIQEALVLMSTIVRKYDLNIVNEDDPKKWGLWNVDPAKRKGRYDIQVTLAFRGGLDVKVKPVA